MARSWFRRTSAAVAVGALTAAVPLLVTPATAEAQAAAPGVNVCVFYGICAGPTLPGR